MHGKIRHPGTHIITIPAVTRQRLVTDPKHKDFGSVVEEAIEPAREEAIELSVDHAFGPTLDKRYFVRRDYVVGRDVSLEDAQVLVKENGFEWVQELEADPEEETDREE